MKKLLNCIRFFPAVFLLTLGPYYFAACWQRDAEGNPPPPPEYQQRGAFIQKLPYFNPDSCVLLIQQNVPKQWQGAAYQNLFLDGPEDSPLSLGYKHLETYEKNFPADSATQFAQMWRSRLYVIENKLDSAQACIEAAQQIALRRGSVLGACDIQMQLVDLLYTQGKTAQAIRTQLKTHETLEKFDSTQNLRKLTSMLNLVSSFSQGNNDREALRWAQRAQALLQTDPSPAFVGQEIETSLRLSVIYQRLSILDSAWHAGQEALNQHQKHPNFGSRAQLLLNLGDILLQKGDCAEALRQFHAAHATVKTDSWVAQQSTLFQSMSEAYFCLGRLDSAEIFQKAALNIAKGQPTEESFALSKLSEIKAKQGDFRAAYETLVAGLKIKEAYFSPKKVAEIGVVKSELELERSERKAEHLAEEKRNIQQQGLILVLAALSVIVFLGSLFLRQRARRRILEQDKWLLEQENQLLEKDRTLIHREKQLAEALTQLKTQELERSETQLKSTQTELNSAQRALLLKNQLIEDLKMRLAQQHRAPQDSNNESKPNAAADNLRRMKILTDEDWARFRERFEEIFPGFMFRLKDQFPDLTSAEKRLFMLYKLKFDHQEIADTLGISLQSVYRSRYRLKTKVGLAESADLDFFVANFSSKN